MLDFNLQVAAATFFWTLSFLSVFGVVFSVGSFADSVAGKGGWKMLAVIFSLLLCVVSFAIAFGLSAA